MNFGSGELSDWTANPERTTAPADRAAADVWLFGDSITGQTQEDLAERLAQQGIRLAYNSVGGRPTDATVAALAAWLDTTPAPPVVVLAAGANNVFDPRFVADQVDRAVGLLPTGTTILWRDAYVCRTTRPIETQVADLRNTGLVNAQLHLASARHPGLHIIEWYAFLASRPDLLAQRLRDGVHVSEPDGVTAHNDLVLQHLEPQLRR
ncbi:hypothetical protein [Microlunatus sp. Y2014]|uniref:hypothetical protein n=1 Tax=Microlunatus sp. Y2014 TaxID=3418488 RepID=UPI003DA7392C